MLKMIATSVFVTVLECTKFALPRTPLIPDPSGGLRGPTFKAKRREREDKDKEGKERGKKRRERKGMGPGTGPLHKFMDPP